MHLPYAYAPNCTLSYLFLGENRAACMRARKVFGWHGGACVRAVRRAHIHQSRRVP